MATSAPAPNATAVGSGWAGTTMIVIAAATQNASSATGAVRISPSGARTAATG